MFGLELTQELVEQTGKVEKDKESRGRVSLQGSYLGKRTHDGVYRVGRERTEDDALKTDGQMPFQVNGGFRLTRAKVGAISRFAHGKRGSWCPRLQ